MARASLTPKQRQFVEEYLIDRNATQAAVRAGYSAKTAHAIGFENLRKPAIAEAVSASLDARAERTRVDADWLLARLAAEAEADIADLYDDAGDLKPVKAWPMIWRQGLVADVAVEVTEKTGEKTAQVKKIKIVDRIKRLELIGKHIDVSAIRDDVALSGDVTVVNVGTGIDRAPDE